MWTALKPNKRCVEKPFVVVCKVSDGVTSVKIWAAVTRWFDKW